MSDEIAQRPESGADMLLSDMYSSTDIGQNHISITQQGIEPKMYKRRWFMLFLFVTFSFSNAYQWIHLNIIGNVIIRFYNESLPDDSFQAASAIDWLSMLYMLVYIPLIFPVTWLLDKKGLRVILICGAFLNTLGAWLKCVCVSTDRFAVLMFAQTICAIAQIFMLGIPARLAAVWFGPNQVSTATSIGVFGNQLGGAAGFLIPPLLVPNSDDLADVGHDLSIMFYIWAGFTTSILILIILVFRAAPPRPPSKAQMLAGQAGDNEHYGKSLLNLIKNKGFILLTITYGINAGCYYGIGTLLNPIILYYFPGHEEHAGQIGLTLVLAGVLGSIVAGIWLDRTKTFKGTTVGICFLSMVSMVTLTFTMDVGLIWLVFLMAGSLGFFMTGYLPVGFQFAAEITYPESEGTSSGLLNASAQIMIRDKYIARRILKSYMLMLDFYGIAMSNRQVGKLQRAENYKSRFLHLNNHNFNRIARITKSIGHLGLQHYQLPFVMFLLNEVLVTRLLSNVRDSNLEYWIEAIIDNREREAAMTFFIDHVTHRQNGGKGNTLQLTSYPESEDESIVFSSRRDFEDFDTEESARQFPKSSSAQKDELTKIPPLCLGLARGSS